MRNRPGSFSSVNVNAWFGAFVTLIGSCAGTKPGSSARTW